MTLSKKKKRTKKTLLLGILASAVLYQNAIAAPDVSYLETQVVNTNSGEQSIASIAVEAQIDAAMTAAAVCLRDFV